MKTNTLFLLVFLLSSLNSNAQWFFEADGNPNSFSEMKSGDQSLSVLWWNIASADLNSYFFPKYNKNVLDENLIELASLETAPEILILGEFYEPHHGAGTIDHLKKIYPFFENFPYNADGSPLSIIVFSKYKMTFKYQVDAIDWGPMGASRDDLQAYKNNWAAQYDYPTAQRQFTRSFQAIRVEKNGKIFSIAPAHIAEPWYLIRQKEGKIAAGAALMWGTENPYYYGVLHFRQALESYTNSISTNEPLFLIGDFNVPSSLYGFAPIGYQALSDGFRDIPLNGADATYPAVSSPTESGFPPMNLDHGFSRGNLQSEAAISPRLMGSDHYPIWMVIR